MSRPNLFRPSWRVTRVAGTPPELNPESPDNAESVAENPQVSNPGNPEKPFSGLSGASSREAAGNQPTSPAQACPIVRCLDCLTPVSALELFCAKCYLHRTAKRSARIRLASPGRQARQTERLRKRTCGTCGSTTWTITEQGDACCSTCYPVTPGSPRVEGGPLEGVTNSVRVEPSDESGDGEGAR